MPPPQFRRRSGLRMDAKLRKGSIARAAVVQAASSVRCPQIRHVNGGSARLPRHASQRTTSVWSMDHTIVETRARRQGDCSGPRGTADERTEMSASSGRRPRCRGRAGWSSWTCTAHNASRPEAADRLVDADAAPPRGPPTGLCPLSSMSDRRITPWRTPRRGDPGRRRSAARRTA